MQVWQSFMAVCFCESYFVPVVISGLDQIQTLPVSSVPPWSKGNIPALLEYCKNIPVNIHDEDEISDLRPLGRPSITFLEVMEIPEDYFLIYERIKETCSLSPSLYGLISLFTVCIWEKRQEYIYPNILGSKQWLPAAMGIWCIHEWHSRCSVCFAKSQVAPVGIQLKMWPCHQTSLC